MNKLTRLTPILLIALLLLLGACAWLQPKDDENPVIQISTPTNYFSYATTQETIDLAGTAFDNRDIKSVTVKVNNSSPVTATGTTNWSLKDIALAKGDNIIVCEAKDKKGNSGTATIIVTRNTDIDFTGHPTFSQSSFFVSQAGYSVVRQTLTPVNCGVSEVQVARVDSNFEVINEIGQIYDDGDLYDHHDEILGDGTYSNKLSILENYAGQYYYRIVAYSDAKVANYSPLYKITVHEAITQDDINKMLDNHAGIAAALNASDATNLEQGAEKLKTWFEGRPGVTKAELVDGSLEVTYDTGIKGGVIFCETDENGYITTKGGSATPARPNANIPLRKQTRGQNALENAIANLNWNTAKVDDADKIQDKDVLIWAPYEGVFDIDMRPSLQTIFENSDLGLNVVSLRNQQCTVASLANLAEYGTVILDTHGASGEHILTGELMNVVNIWSHIFQILNNEVGFFERVTYSTVGGFAQKGTVYSVRSAYIANLGGTMPNSLIFNGSCESSQTANLSNAFLGKGAKAYFGFSKIVSTSFCKAKADEIFQKMAVELKNNGKAFVAGQQDPFFSHATFTMNATTNELHYSFDLINGNFEFGNLSGWFREGDGRVITQLGDQQPTEGNFMGIISTGLGYTESSGSISQPFRVPDSVETLSIRWNFISEEFMEYVGSQYQDYLTISITDSTGAVHVIFHETIDSFVDYGLVCCTPPISFDQGDCYMTGWRQLVHDISAFQGQVVRLRIACGDVGDSIYDSACLLDEITIY